MAHQVTAIVSGGQTGADQAGLYAAREVGINTGGFVPKGWITEDGLAPWLDEYGLIEADNGYYETRTLQNVLIADATVIFGRRSQGSNLTERYCMQHGRPFMWVFWPDLYVRAAALRLWLVRGKYRTLNVAGNRESKNPGIGQFTKEFLIKALEV